MITRPIRKNEIRKFTDFAVRLYEGDDNYTPYMRRDLIKTLERLIFEEKSYRGLMTQDEDGNVLARILLTVGASRKLNTDRCGYFCLYECVNDMSVSREILSKAAECLKKMGADCMCGPFTPFDPDNRRGLLIRGFDTPPMIFTSYNFRYYENQLMDFGMTKQVDANSYLCIHDKTKADEISRIADFILKRSDFHVEHLNMSDLEKDVTDLHYIMEQASTEINYQDVISADEMMSIAEQWKFFLDPRFIIFARKNEDNAPVGVVVSLPDYFEIIRKIRGIISPASVISFLKYRKNISGLRGILQYVIPEYQSRGAAAVLYNETRKSMEDAGIKRLELGTIMENNRQSNSAVEAFGGKLYRVYRIYCKNL